MAGSVALSRSSFQVGLEQPSVSLCLSNPSGKFQGLEAQETEVPQKQYFPLLRVTQTQRPRVNPNVTGVTSRHLSPQVGSDLASGLSALHPLPPAALGPTKGSLPVPCSRPQPQNTLAQRKEEPGKPSHSSPKPPLTAPPSQA